MWILFCVLLTLFVLYSLRPGFKIRLKSDGSLPANIGNIHVIHDKMYGAIDADSFGLEEVNVFDIDVFHERKSFAILFGG